MPYPVNSFSPCSPWFRILAFALALIPGVSWGSLTWETRQIQRTAKPGEKEVVAAFVFKNTGTTTVTIRDIQSGCECTVGELEKRTYAPGEGGSIKAIFTIGGRIGRQEKQLSVSTDDPAAPTSTLELRVDIEELLALSDRILRWPLGGGLEERSVEVGALRQDRITAIELKATSPKDRARARIVPVEPGTKYQVFVQPEASQQPQTVKLTFAVHFESGAQSTFSVFALTR